MTMHKPYLTYPLLVMLPPMADYLGRGGFDPLSVMSEPGRISIPGMFSYNLRIVYSVYPSLSAIWRRERLKLSKID
jgi:hypothetical protein